MKDNTIYMKEKENPPRKKEEFSTLKITVSISGEPKNENTSKTTSLKRPKPLVRKVEGPFNEEGKLVEEMIEGQEYIFKATEFQESTFTPIKHIWWAEQLDEGEITDLEYKKGENPYLDEEGTVCFKYTAKKAEKIRIYAYVASPAERVSVEAPIVSFPFVIARSVKRAGLCYGTNGENLTREDITNLNIKYPQQKDLLKQKLEKGFRDIHNYDPKKPEELSEHIKKRKPRVNYALEYIEEYNKYTDDELFDIFKNDLDDWALGELDDNLHDMIDFFKQNNSTANRYEDKRLIDAIAEHSSTKNFIEGFSRLLQREINEKGHTLNKLRVIETQKQFIEDEYKLGEDHPNADPKILGILGLQDLSSLKYTDKLSGLGISVDGTQAYDISLTDFSISNEEYNGKFSLEIFDHFGLDSSDILKDIIRKNEEFICWFMLQHLRGYKPFITYIPLNYSFKGSINKNNIEIKLDENL